MCGIFGIAVSPKSAISKSDFRALLGRLYVLSESRGKESAGLHIYLPTRSQAWTIKGAKPASELLESEKFKATLNAALDLAYASNDASCDHPLVAIAHSRLVTNGKAESTENNQPVRWADITVIHNGIVVNVDDLWKTHSHLTRHAEVDTEVLAALLADAMTQAPSPIDATRCMFAQIKGSASLVWVNGRNGAVTLASNTGDLYLTRLPKDTGLVFASERFILETALRELNNPELKAAQHLPAGCGLCLELGHEEALMHRFSLFGTEAVSGYLNPVELPVARQNDVSEATVKTFTPVVRHIDESLLRYNEKRMREIKRCTCCVLPETFPFIEFDAKGVCNYCRGYKPKYKGIDAEAAKKDFIESVQKYRSADGSPDVLVPFSGGRDSCYGLHLIKNEFGLNPITFTYDWGMVTDLARRNTARFCGQLGVQNILVSADIKTKRENIRKNVTAWLNKPDLGMVPLFMAGDKHFFKIVNDLKRQTGIKLDLWSANPLENTDFKSGFCGVAPDFDKSRVDYLSITRKVRLALYYLSRFVGNPGYVNSSLLDTGQAFMSYYIEPRYDFFFMFSHMVWNEDEVNRIINDQYDFERSPDSPSTWRIGDGTAPFYNYIYMTANGFTEFDTFRSNQIREGQITREQGLESILLENRPRTESLIWYLDTVGLDFDSTIRRVNALDKRGLHA